MAGNLSAAAPRLLGRPLSDLPLEQVHPRAPALWDAARSALEHALRPPSSHASATELQQWLRDTFQPWMVEHRTRLSLVDALAREVAGADARARLVAAVVLAVVSEDFVEVVRRLPPPSPIAQSAPMLEAFHEALEGAMVPMRQRVREAFERCALQARAAPAALGAWETVCRTHAEAFPVAPAQPSVPATPTDRAAAWPAECEGEERWEEPEAPAPDDRARRELVVLFDPDETDTRFDAAARLRVRETVAARLRALVRIRQVPAAEVSRAERLHAERRWTETGPVCGQAPPLLALLAARHRNLVVARAGSMCFLPDPRGPEARSGEQCVLDVYYHRAGSGDRRGLPEPISVSVEGDASRTDSWVAAARALGRRGAGVGMLGLIGTGGGGGPIVRLRGVADDDPWLRVGPTLWAAEAALAACRSLPGTSSHRLRWTISIAGETVSPEVEPITEDGAGLAVQRCLRETLATRVWPCPRSGQPVGVEARVCIRR